MRMERKPKVTILPNSEFYSLCSKKCNNLNWVYVGKYVLLGIVSKQGNITVSTRAAEMFLSFKNITDGRGGK